MLHRCLLFSVTGIGQQVMDPAAIKDVKIQKFRENANVKRCFLDILTPFLKLAPLSYSPIIDNYILIIYLFQEVSTKLQ